MDVIGLVWQEKMAKRWVSEILPLPSSEVAEYIQTEKCSKHVSHEKKNLLFSIMLVV